MVRGRPKKAEHEQHVKKALLKATADELSNKSYASISIREIAKKAATNSSMISYHFGNKQGLVTALLQSVLTTNASATNMELDLVTLKPRKRTETIILKVHSLGKQHPWLFRMILDDLGSQESVVGEMLTETFAEYNNKEFSLYFDLQIKDRYFRKNINRDLAKISLLSLLIFPQLASPIFKNAYGVDITTIETKKWIKHTADLFEAGFKTQNKSR